MCAKLDGRRIGLENLKKKYPGFKILRGYEKTVRGRKLITLFIVKSKKPRTGTLERFCKDRLEENKSILISQPTTVAMMNFLQKNRFFRLQEDTWILTPLT